MGAANTTFDVPSDTLLGELGAVLMRMENWATHFAGPPPSAIDVDSFGTIMSMADFCEMAGDTCKLSDVGAVTLMMTSAVRPSVALRIIFDDESDAGSLQVLDDSTTSAQILVCPTSWLPHGYHMATL